jgi:hypothetical protein
MNRVNVFYFRLIKYKLGLKYLHEVNTTVKLALEPDLRIQVLLVSQPETATDRTFP